MILTCLSIYLLIFYRYLPKSNLLSYIPIFAFLAFRNSFGPDTLRNFNNAKKITQDDAVLYVFEPLWVYFLKVADFFGGINTQLTFNTAWALAACYILILFFRRKSFDNKNILLLLTFPVIFVDLFSNTIRLGMFLFLMVIFRDKWFSPFFALGHSSVVFLVKFRTFFLLLLPALIYYISVNASFVSFFSDKFAFYEQYDSVRTTRGLSDLGVFCVLLIFATPKRIRLRMVFISLSLVAIAPILLSTNYAFVRLLKLALYFMLMSNFFSVRGTSSVNGIIALSAGFVYLVYSLHNFTTGFGVYGY